MKRSKSLPAYFLIDEAEAGARIEFETEKEPEIEVRGVTNNSAEVKTAEIDKPKIMYVPSATNEKNLTFSEFGRYKYNIDYDASTATHTPSTTQQRRLSFFQYGIDKFIVNPAVEAKSGQNGSVVPAVNENDKDKILAIKKITDTNDVLFDFHLQGAECEVDIRNTLIDMTAFLFVSRQGEQKQIYLVTPYIRGKTLRETLNETKDLVEFIRLIKKTLFVFEELHGDGFVHGDLKDDNIMVDHDQKIFYIDLTFGRRIGTPVLQVTEEQKHVAPECRRFIKPAAPAQDIYSLGHMILINIRERVVELEKEKKANTTIDAGNYIQKQINILKQLDNDLLYTLAEDPSLRPTIDQMIEIVDKTLNILGVYTLDHMVDMQRQLINIVGLCWFVANAMKAHHQTNKVSNGVDMQGIEIKVNEKWDMEKVIFTHIKTIKKDDEALIEKDVSFFKEMLLEKLMDVINNPTEKNQSMSQADFKLLKNLVDHISKNNSLDEIIDTLDNAFTLLEQAALSPPTAPAVVVKDKAVKTEEKKPDVEIQKGPSLFSQAASKSKQNTESTNSTASGFLHHSKP